MHKHKEIKMSKTMKQQLMTEPHKITIREVEIPKVGPDQVLVKMKKMGICGSDIHVYHGTHPYTSYPVTQGHEVSGEIVEVGEYVKDLKVGQHVTIEPQVFCGRCYPCLHGKYNLCEHLKVMGFQTTGAASEYFAVDSSKITLLPEGMTIVDMTLGDRAANSHKLMSRKQADGSMRVLTSSIKGETFSGNEGAVLYIDVKTGDEYMNGSVELTNILFSDTNANTRTFKIGSEATGIDTLSTFESLKQQVYSLGGKMMNGLKKGVNIIRNADGSTKKVVK